MAKNPGQTSVYLTEDLRVRVAMSPLTSGELVRRGLDAEGAIREAVQADRAAVAAYLLRELPAAGVPRPGVMRLLSGVMDLPEPQGKPDGRVRRRLERAAAASAPSVVPEDGSEDEAVPEARTVPPARAPRAAPKSRTRASAVESATAALASGDPGAALRKLRSVPPATAVFQAPGDEAQAGYPVPEAADHSAKRRLR